MRRREFMALMAAGVAAMPAIAAPQSKMQRIGILMLGNLDPALFLLEFSDSLRELGYSEGKNVALELRNANGSAARLPSLARELVALNVDVLVGFQTPTIVAAKAATREIPIIMCPAQEPVEMGFV